eukprot:CAMPEP_0113855298 /NCGR_PEP_ID=MMETSP0372-20130328/8101_1 /TAXON_ID=340204 /ORGANISM="Lankesteria abbotti" /LENGTH=371 /DNA_ID=CAMNT_0000829169 /DNA_START=47 /DNA_END=1162 /DNA_ORIENTATION=- /assembly_acc=CAM_ASM_000359
MAIEPTVATQNPFAGLESESSDDETEVVGTRTKTRPTDTRVKNDFVRPSAAPVRSEQSGGERRGGGSRGMRGQNERRGGYNTGGYNTGGNNTGGYNTGGYNTGGNNTGGYNTGGGNEFVGGSDEELNQRRNERVFRGGGDRGRGRPPMNRGREFDRHVSGTNRSRAMKKGGAHNWGNAHEDFGGVQKIDQDVGVREPTVEDDNGQWDDDTATRATPDENDNTTDKKPEEEGAAAPAVVEEEPIDLEEYRRRQEANRPNLPPPPSTTNLKTTKIGDLEKEGFKKHVKEADEDARLKFNTAPINASNPYGKSIRDPSSLEAAIFGSSQHNRRGRGGRGRGMEDRPISHGAPPAVRKVRNLNLQDSQAFPCLEV